MDGDGQDNPASEAPPQAEDTAMQEVVETTTLPEDRVMTEAVAEDLGSQSLDDLGVSVMDQDVLERNVAAQVRYSY